MKTYIFSALLCFICLSVSAQHLEFMGIQIDGSVALFQQQLLHKGFTQVKDKYNLPYYVVLEGKYDNEPCLLYIRYNQKTNVVYSVSVCIEKENAVELYNIKDKFEKYITENFKQTPFQDKLKDGRVIDKHSIHSNVPNASDLGWMYAVMSLKPDFEVNRLFLTFEDMMSVFMDSLNK